MMLTSDSQNQKSHTAVKQCLAAVAKKMEDLFSTFSNDSVMFWCSLHTSDNVNDEPLA